MPGIHFIPNRTNLVGTIPATGKGPAMKFGSLTALLLAAAMIILSPVYAQALPQLGKSPIDEVIAALTTEEKVLLVLGTGINAPNAAPDRQAPLVGGRNFYHRITLHQFLSNRRTNLNMTVSNAAP